jgi:hypothetical protein
MKKFIPVVVLMLAFAAASFSATRTPIFEQNVPVVTVAQSDEDVAALSELTGFAAEHKLIGGYRDGTPGTFDVALFATDDDGQATGDGPKWVVYGAASLTVGVKQIEADFAQYPDGHVTGTAPSEN